MEALFFEAISNAMSNLMTKADSEIPNLDSIASPKSDHHDQLVQEGLPKLLTTGQPAANRIWRLVCAIASGGVTISRDVVLGNYLGTNHLIQLADTFGIKANAGLLMASTDCRAPPPCKA